MRSPSCLLLSRSRSHALTRSLSFPPFSTLPTQRDGSLPAPTTGRIVEAPFPPPPVDRPELDIDEEALAERAREQAGPVEVVRFYPTGEQDKVTNLAVTFNQPMVAVRAPFFWVLRACVRACVRVCVCVCVSCV